MNDLAERIAKLKELGAKVRKKPTSPVSWKFLEWGLAWSDYGLGLRRNALAIIEELEAKVERLEEDLLADDCHDSVSEEERDALLTLLEAVEKRGSWHSGEMEEMARRAREASGG